MHKVLKHSNIPSPTQMDTQQPGAQSSLDVHLTPLNTHTHIHTHTHTHTHGHAPLGTHISRQLCTDPSLPNTSQGSLQGPQFQSQQHQNPQPGCEHLPPTASPCWSPIQLFIPGQHSWLLPGLEFAHPASEATEVLLLFSSSILALLGFSFYTPS